MSKKLIVSIMLGNDPSFHFVKKSFSAYADRVGADLIFITKSSDNFEYVGRKNSPFIKALCEKLNLEKYLRYYERVLYLDGDILIAPDARDVFEVCSDTRKVYMLDEGALSDRSKQSRLIAERLGVADPSRHYFNAGVILFSREGGFLGFIDKEDVRFFFDHGTFMEQCFINFSFLKKRTPVIDIGAEFNRMGLSGKDESRFLASFVHYAGHGYSHKKHRARTIMRDYCRLYQYTPTFAERFAFLVGTLRSKLKI